MEQRSGMVEKRGMGLWLTHGFMITGVLIIFFPIWLAFVASTVTQPEIVSPPMPLLPGGHFWKNYKSCYIRKENPLLEYPGVFRQHMFKIHQGYLNILKPMNKIVDKLYVIKYVNNLDPAQIMFAVNFVYRDLKVDEEKKKLELNSM